MITEFGRRSFITWTVGLIEKVKKAEQEEHKKVQITNKRIAKIEEQS